ncbi:MAG TPA: hypothetical protein VK735_44895 [Pseudonocardia sp.]|uniref:hypothetical protein n=1 Tax=Pseudonocardia sp. TaxID=60912 RepID=UPI002B78D49E|nr:hypothetical protein [Pseudonocardia sp.]HTF54625.1 hypothetical protein [Pseudonocardia sp.]
MPRVRGLVVALACAVGAVLGLSSATLADATLAACGGMAAGRSGQAGPAVRPVDHADSPGGRHLLIGAVCDQRDEAAPRRPGAPFVATATRHVPSSTRALPPGVENPVTDRAMALLIGWAMLALVGGGLFAGRRPRRVTGSRQ